MAFRTASTFGEFVKLFPEVLTLVVGGASGGASRVRLAQETTRRRIVGKQPNPNSRLIV